MKNSTEWPETERPRERLSKFGAISLSDTELLALLLGTGTASENVVDTSRRIIAHVGGIEDLALRGLGALSRIPGLGKVKASRLIAAFELGVRVAERRAGKQQRQTFCDSQDIFDAYCARLAALRQEVFMVLGLNNKNQVIREITVAMGSLNECVVEPREVFRPLILEAAARAILIHNHPSGDPTPSTHDVSVTRRLIQVGDLLGIPILDHIIIGHSSHASLRELGLILEFDSVG